MKRYALLVGINSYQKSNGVRTFDDGSPVLLPDLKGCLNDVAAIRKALLSHYEMTSDEIQVLSSPPLDCAIDGSSRVRPVQPNSRLPTFANIRREFEVLFQTASAGDFFYFHFSGHGGRIPRILDSPLSRETDPSLLTVDFCRGGRAVRGWELNEWLRILNQKGLIVVVSLDSCYSGGSWRSHNGPNNTGYRSPADWESRLVKNLDSDKVAIGEQPQFRAGYLQTLWSLNPENFTLLTACGVDQLAAERKHNKKMHGYFTYHLMRYLEHNKYRATYRMALEHLQQVLKPQTPQLHGLDKFLYFGNEVPFFVTPFKASITTDGRLELPAGKAHGVGIDAEFVPFPSQGNLKIRVTTVTEFTSSARISNRARSVLRRHNNTVVASKWCLANGSVLRIVLEQDLKLAEAFDEHLRNALKSHIANPVEVTRSSETSTEGPCSDMVFRIKTQNQRDIQIWGTEALIGYNDAVRPLRIRYSDDIERLATEAASSLVHLSRFGTLLNTTSEHSLSFQVSLLPVTGGTKRDCYQQDQRFTYCIQNNDCRDLYFVILNFTPEFGIEQIWPQCDGSQRVATGRQFKLPSTLSFQLPHAPAEVHELLHTSSRRELIRTLVTARDGISWKTLELPSIWDANQVQTSNVLDSRVCVLEKFEEWSVHDNELILGI